HPVDVRWAPPRPRQRLADSATAAVLRALREEEGDVLVFLPGAADIRRVESALARRVPPGTDLRPLFGALPATAQDAALDPSPPGRRRVVLATDIAETSLTVEGVRVVVDAGQARRPRYDARSGLTRLHTGPASRASADQRAGRAGRTGPGVAYRLWSKIEHAARRPFPDPEMASVDLAGLALEVALWGSDPAALPFLDRPPARALDEAGDLLAQLGALDADGRPTPEGRAMAELPLHPRLARMVTGGAALGLGTLACALAALLEDRDVLRGAPDEVPVDVAERVRLILERSATHPRADRSALGGARRRTAELARRAGLTMGPEPVDLAHCGLALALAYPDRVAQARGGGRFRLRSGGGAWVPTADPLAGEPFLVVAELDADRRDSRIRLAAALDPGDVEVAAGTAVEEFATLAWDAGRDDLRATVERRVGGLVLGRDEGPAEPGPATTRALLERARATRLGVLRWTDDARALQRRAAFARRVLGDAWPDLSDAALVESAGHWLAPLLARATGRADLEAVDVARALRMALGPVRSAELDRVAPRWLAVGDGRRVTIDYAPDQPSAAVRVQDLFGTTVHPTVAGGRVPVVLHLLSPAGRPVQVTADLPGFWAGSWGEVRREMAGRYPKHAWPLDPATAPGGRR
ncbi:MAG: ATP-dependent helicase HrpB, partial [Actinomycetota bacterium]|nr:ATP-dependent helicase HrpB [Actinomycetota bacterium]